MPSMNLKELKSRLDDDCLDLSLSELTNVPVNEIAQLKKARKIDLSINKLTLLTDDFAVQLTFLVHLDLSQNQLRKLPDNFGRLVNLQRLELYKNQLKDLPLSFLSLKSLQWLDVKDNPLSPQLQAVCGDCLDAKQCNTAAKNVVKYMRDLDSNMERKKQQKLKEQRAKEAAEAQVRKQQESKAAEEKKRARDAKKQSKKARAAEKAKTGGSGDAAVLRNGTSSANGDDKCHCPERSFLGNVCSFLLFLLTVTGGLTLIAALGTFWLCSSQAQLFNGQRDYCNQAYMLLVTTDLADQRKWLSAKLEHAPDWVKAPLDVEWGKLAGRVADAGRQAATKVKPGLHWALEQSKVAGRVVAERAVKTKVWVEKSAPGWKKKAKESWEYTKASYPRWRDNVCKWTAHAMSVTLEYTLVAMEWTKDTVVHVYEQLPVYWENLKFYWHNMK